MFAANSVRSKQIRRITTPERPFSSIDPMEYRIPLERPDNPTGELICMHHAGGASHFFKDWDEYFERALAITAIELPGRGRRFGEEIPDRLERVADEIADELADSDLGNHGPVVLFGHSLGAVIGYEVARRLGDNPGAFAHFVASGAGAPRAERSLETLHILEDDELLERLREMGGTPPKVLENPELMELFLPVIRADLQLLETHVPEDPAPLDVPITAIGGNTDERTSDGRLDKWRNFTKREFAIRWFPGGHFYLEDHLSEILGWLEAHLAESGAFDLI